MNPTTKQQLLTQLRELYRTAGSLNIAPEQSQVLRFRIVSLIYKIRKLEIHENRNHNLSHARGA